MPNLGCWGEVVSADVTLRALHLRHLPFGQALVPAAQCEASTPGSWTGEQPNPSSGPRGTVGYREWVFEDINASLPPKDDCGHGFLMEAANFY